MTFTNHSPTNLNLSHSRTDNRLFDLFSEDTEIFTTVKPRTKEGFGSSFLETLHTADESQYLLDRNRNVGIALGVETEHGFTVVFDHEMGGSIPQKVERILAKYAIASWESCHNQEDEQGAINHLLTVSERAYQKLAPLKEKVNITGGNSHDLEILTSGHALIPPSQINHTHCSESKPCDGQGISSYNLIETHSPQLVGLDTVERILTPLPVEQSNSTGTEQSCEGRNGNEEVDLHELQDGFNPNAYFKEHIPGNDSYPERLDTMLQVPEIQSLWMGDYQDRSENELRLRSYVAFYFNADRKMVQYIFEEELPEWREEPLKYGENKHHAKDVLNIQISRPYYTTAISFDLWEQLATVIMNKESVTVNELHEEVLRTDDLGTYEKRSIRRALEIFEKKNIIKRKSKSVVENKEIDQQYLSRLKQLIKEYNPTKLVNYD